MANLKFLNMKKTLIVFSLALLSYCNISNAQLTQPTTIDNVALPSTVNSAACVYTGTNFNAPANYIPDDASIQLGVNNTGTDSCIDFAGSKLFQAMVWDNVTALSPLTSTVYLSCNFNGSPIFQQTFSGGLDPDVAISSDSSGTYIQIVFENNTTNRIDGYVYKYNGTTFVPYLFKATFSNNFAKKAKNPNIAVPKYGGSGIGLVWHEEGLVTPAQTLTVTYNTTPAQNFVYNVSLLESKVYIYVDDKTGPVSGSFASPTSTIINYAGNQVKRPNTNHLFERDYNPDVSFSEMSINTGSTITRGVSVVFLSQWFDPSTFSTVSGDLTVVQGARENYLANPPSTTNTNFTTQYGGKPRIAARLSNGTTSNLSKDFSVVMGNSSTLAPCNVAPTTTSKLHNWWFQTGGTICPVAGSDLLVGTIYSSKITVNPVITCINGIGDYNITFSTKDAPSATSGMDIISKTYRAGGAITNPTAFNLVNRSACTTVNYPGNQVIPSVTSIRINTGSTTLNADTDYLFWDQNSKTVNFKQFSTSITTGTGAALRQVLVNSKKPIFKVFPNPSESKVTFNFELENKEIPYKIEIYNLLGQSVAIYKINDKDKEIKTDISNLQSGTYIAILKSSIKEYKLQFIKK